ncbi:MAG TPA: hypothetical protein VMR45_03725 [Patescibacteria group bacterium]|nr:hypothetical protein [Patescibacteria group bacterium]
MSRSNLTNPNRITPKDALVARTLSVGSMLANALPKPASFVVKAEDAPSYTPIRWRHWGLSAGGYRGEWAHFDGVKTAGLTPRNYAAAAIVLVDREKIDQFADRHGPRVQQAVAYRLGSAVMFGVSPKHDEIFGLEAPEAEDYSVAMRIGRGPLDAGVGLWLPNRYDRIFLPLENGVRPGPIMPIAEVPASIPLV